MFGVKQGKDVMEGRTVAWEVLMTSKAIKQKNDLPEDVSAQLWRLILDIERIGPIQKGWSHFSALKKDKRIPEGSYHCHIKSGRPTYVVCWRVENKKIKIVEIFYVGTHENTPY